MSPPESNPVPLKGWPPDSRPRDDGAERHRQESELFRLLVENSRDYAIFTIDLEGRVLTWNGGAERLLGYREDEIVGRSSSVIFTPEDRAAGVPRRELQAGLTEGRAGDDR